MESRRVGLIASSQSAANSANVCLDGATYVPRFTLPTRSASAASASRLVR